jgi:hypothetical protein
MGARTLVSLLLSIRCTAGLLFGCASTKTELSGAVASAPVCQQPGDSLSALVFWALELRVLDAGSGASLASFRTHWQNGGAMVIKGVSSLPQDMRAALYEALQPRPLPK